MTTLTVHDITVVVTAIFPNGVAGIIAGYATCYTCKVCKKDVTCAENLSSHGICWDCARLICVSCNAKNPGYWGVDNSCLECQHYVCCDCTYKFLEYIAHTAFINDCEEGNDDNGTIITWYEHEYCWTHCPPEESDEEVSSGDGGDEI